MGTPPTAMIKPPRSVLCKFQTVWLSLGLPLGLAVGLVCLLVAGSNTALAANGAYETWSSETVTLEPLESFQLKVSFEQIQVRNWKLVVDGAEQNCDVNVLRLKDESLIYQENDGRHHEVLIPWGRGEEVSIVITNRRTTGVFEVALMGPPRDQIHASYSYHVNRALDKFSGGERLSAEDECRKALIENPDDGVAKVLLAGFLRDRNYFERASALVTEALAGDLPEAMMSIAQSMRQELVALRAPLPLPVRRGVQEVEDLLIAGDAEPALGACDKLLSGDLELDVNSRSTLLTLRGQALDQLGRNFESLDAFTNALQLNRNKAKEGSIYFHMGRLFLQMDNLIQAQGAFTMALQSGLPSGLDVQAREFLMTIESLLRD